MTTQLEIDYALMAGASYISTRPDINRFPVPQGWTEQLEFRARNDSSGFEATTFRNAANPNEIVISFAGTYPRSLSDLPQSPWWKNIYPTNSTSYMMICSLRHVKSRSFLTINQRS
ncbi:MAG: hypothetical protein V1791_00060 [Pseudomonadota bacterium]